MTLNLYQLKFHEHIQQVIEIGKTYKYQEFCELLDIEPLDIEYRSFQYNQLMRHMAFTIPTHRNKHTKINNPLDHIKVIRIYNTPQLLNK